MRLGKLVRDNMPEIMKRAGKEPVFKIVEGKEYWDKLKEKLEGEVMEFSANESKEEVADILEVVNAICEFRGFDMGEIERIRLKKLGERGGFRKGLVLEGVK
ncbi:MAG: nucleoside triphosphate pyrophosphohydrolase [Candidatus Aenigmarchaeota archaeon]|nr:nucleoside triphosphate pyrophosphohydrolase [Candidatus Aenigmarchaeota archaeon]